MRNSERIPRKCKMHGHRKTSHCHFLTSYLMDSVEKVSKILSSHVKAENVALCPSVSNCTMKNALVLIMMLSLIVNQKKRKIIERSHEFEI